MLSTLTRVSLAPRKVDAGRAWPALKMHFSFIFCTLHGSFAFTLFLLSFVLYIVPLPLLFSFTLLFGEMERREARDLLEGHSPPTITIG